MRRRSNRLCEYALTVTGSPLVAQVVDWILAKPLEILLIIVVALIANAFCRRVIRRLTTTMMSGIGGGKEPRSQPAPTSPLVLKRGTDDLRVKARANPVRASSQHRVVGELLDSRCDGLGGVGGGGGASDRRGGYCGHRGGVRAQTLVADFLTGLFMLVEDQYGVGDTIDTGFCVGEVEAVSLRTTKVRDAEGTLWHIPNGRIERIGNLSQEWARTLLDLNVAYDTDLDQARRVLEGCFASLWDDPEWRPVLIERPEVLGVQDFGVSGIILRIIVKTEPAKQWPVGRELRQRIKVAFDAEGIEMPYTQAPVMVNRDKGSSRDQPQTTGLDE